MQKKNSFQNYSVYIYFYSVYALNTQPNVNVKLSLTIISILTIATLIHNLKYFENFVARLLIIVISLEVANHITFIEKYRVSILLLTTVFLEWGLNIKRLNGKGKINLPIFLIILTIACILNFPTLIGNNVNKMTLYLRGYDFVAHSYLEKIFALCNSNLSRCDSHSLGIPYSADFASYPSAYHGLFGSLLRQGIKNDDTYLLSFGIANTITFTLSGLILYYGIMSYFQATSVSKKIASKLLLKNRFKKIAIKKIPMNLVLLLFIALGPLNFFLFLGYSNFLLAYSLIITGTILLLKTEKTYLALLIILFACEIWTFFYCVYFIIIALHLSKSIGSSSYRSRVILTLLYVAGIFQLIINSITGSHTRGSLASSNHWPEALALYFLLAITIRRSKLTNPNFTIRNFAIALLLPLLVFQCYLLFNRQLGSYYIWKASLAFIPLTILFLCEYAIKIEVDEFKNLNLFFRQNRLAIKIEKRKNQLKFLISLLIIIWIIPANFMKVPSLREKAGYSSPISNLLQNFFPKNVIRNQASLIVNNQSKLNPHTPVVFLEPNYWVLSTAWMNNLNDSFNSNLIPYITHLNTDNTDLRAIQEEIYKEPLSGMLLIANECKEVTNDLNCVVYK